MSTTSKKRRYQTTSSPNESDDDTNEQLTSSTSQLSNKRRGSVAADFASHRLIVSERQQMAVLKQLTAGEESNTGSQSPSSLTPQPRPSKINRRNEHGETIVHITARKGDLKQLRKVLKAGANVNEADNAGWTPLHEAVTKNQFKAARLLLQSGANSNAPGPEGQTPLVDAVLNNNTKMVELLLNYSADPSVVDLTRLNETMLKVLKRETTVLDSSDNENDDESISPLSPLTSDNEYKNLVQRSKFAKIQRKPIRRFRERSSQSSDSSSYSKTRTTSGNNDTSLLPTTGKNPYDFESEEDNEIREPTNETHDENKKKTVRKQDNTKQRANSGGSIQLNENSNKKKHLNKIDLVKEQEQQKFRSTSDDEQIQIYRVPPLKIVLARAIVHRTSDIESLNSSNMDNNNNNNNNLTVDTSSLSMPIIEQNEKLLSSMSSSVPITSSDSDEKIVFHNEYEQDNEIVKINRNKNSSHMSNLDYGKIDSSLSQSQSPQTVIGTMLDSIITQIETNNDNQLNSLPIIEDDQMEVDDDDEEDDENENENENENDDDDDDVEQGTIEKNESNKSIIKVDKERSTTKNLSSSSSSSTTTTTKRDLKPTTRTLRSHARAKINLSTSIQSSSNAYNNVRRVSSRRRALEKKLFLNTTEKEKKRKSISERSKKDKDNTTTNDDIHTSSYSDDQTIENTNVEKLSHTTANPNDDASSCSSTGAGDGSSTSSSTINNKQSNTNADIDSLPPNKRRLRERNTGITNTSMPSLTTDASNNSNSTSNIDNSPSESMATREIPINSIKQFLEIRQQIDKRHETMLNEFILPKVPKDFSDTTMAKKSYLIAPQCSSYSTTTPASIGIKRLSPPHDLDAHLADVFTKQEDERYKMKLRHQVERDKLILSHEQEVLRLCGNATRSSHNQDTPLSYCSLLKDNEVYNDPSIQLPEKFINNDCTNTELNKRGKHRWNGRSFIKWLEDSNLKYKRLSCELNERQRLEADTLYSMQRMVWLKHLPKESASLSSSGRMSYLLTERYLPKVEINPNFWTTWETSPF
ncbi:unnamed protein product [Rotaria sp. Silwood1]|nr:unnamed protein product [Rotaria sp. Silwood1]